MLATRWFRAGTCLAIVMAAGLAASGCTSPRYGTDKTAMEQLTDDLGQSVSLTGNPPKNKGVKYTPRPTLLLPSQTARADLVQPQQSIASKDNPQWVESPEETRARLVKEADANSENSAYRSPLAQNGVEGGRKTAEEQQKAFREARTLQKGAYIDQRRFISDPPSEYRQVDPDKLSDLGTPELKKAKERKKQAAVEGTNKSWWNFLQ